MTRKQVPSRLTERIAAKLRGRAAEGGVTGVELAEATGISQSQMSKLLRGVRVFDIDQLDAVCQVLGLTIRDLVTEAYNDVIETVGYEDLPGLLDEYGERISHEPDEYTLAAMDEPYDPMSEADQ